MRTTPIIEFGANALAIKADASFLYEGPSGNLQSFSDLDDLITGLVVTKPYATYETDFWLLDGGYKFKPATAPHVGLMSLEKSSGTGALDSPTLTITFTQVFSTNGITLRGLEYSNDFPDNINVEFYNASNGIIRADNYQPTTWEFSTGQAVANFKKIVIYFNFTNKPFRYLRLTGIDFDDVVRFTGEDVKAASVVEQINPLSVELPINTLELDLFSSDADFSIVAPAGFYANLQYKEPLDVHEDLGGWVIYIGRFYLDSWESKSANEAHFEASDAIGLLDKPKFLGGLYGSPTILSEDLIAEIMTTAGLSYELDATLEGIVVDGLINLYAPCREALQQTCFYIGAYVTCARSNLIRILPLPLPPGVTGNDRTLTATEKGISSPLTLKPFVTGVEIHEKEYISDEFPTGEVLFEESLGTGNHIVMLGKGSKIPSSLVLGGTATYSITTNRYFYCIINVTGAGTVKLTQNEGLTEIESITGEYNPSVPAGTQENILTIDDATLMRATATTGKILTADVAQRVYDYFQQRYLQKTRLFASLMVIGESVLVDVQSSQQMSGIVERMETDLAGGYISNVEIIGVIV